ncbi:MAG: hypothetical protein FOGNACKC_02265 [Anaerolineae bacterium]|nr:hypothetical protein [Anaerolineae bacterium]
MDTPQLLCTCGAKLTIDEQWGNSSFGGADTTCPTCGGRWRYIHTPACGWVRAIDLRAYYAYQQRRTP